MLRGMSGACTGIAVHWGCRCLSHPFPAPAQHAGRQQRRHGAAATISPQLDALLDATLSHMPLMASLCMSRPLSSRAGRFVGLRLFCLICARLELLARSGLLSLRDAIAIDCMWHRFDGPTATPPPPPPFSAACRPARGSIWPLVSSAPPPLASSRPQSVPRSGVQQRRRRGHGQQQRRRSRPHARRRSL